MTERLGLLPPNATALEHAVSEALDRLPELGAGAANVHNFKFAEIPSVVPHLIVEYGLGEVAAYLPNPNEAIARGIPWQRLRGTPAALVEGFSWIGETISVHEEPNWTMAWWWFQVEFSQPLIEPLLTAAAAIGDISKPLRSRFARGFWLYDMRALRSSEGDLSGEFLLGDWSGVTYGTLDPVWSFGRETGAIQPAGPDDLNDVWDDDPWDASTWIEDVQFTNATLFGAPAIVGAETTLAPTHVVVGLDLADLIGAPILVGFGPGDAGWDGVVPPEPSILADDYDPAPIIGYRRAKPAFFVSPGQCPYQDGEPWDSYTPSDVATDALLIEAETDFNEYDDQVIREIVIFTDPVFVGTPPDGKHSFALAEVSNPGTPILIFRRPAITLSEVTRERVFLVIQQ